MDAGIPEDEVDVPEGEILARRIEAIVRLTPVMMIANLVNVSATLFALWATYRIDWSSIVWACVVATYAVFLLWDWARHLGRKFPASLSEGTRRRTVAFSVALGIVWAYPGIAILPIAPPLTQAFLVALCGGMVAGGSIAMYPIPSAAYIYSAIIVVGYMSGFAVTGEPVFWAFALVSAMFFVVIIGSVQRHEQIFVSEFLLRRRLDKRAAKVEGLLAETKIEADRQKEEAEARLAQMQRLDSIGRLTAGIAHDFNNLLAAVMGNIELAKERPDHPDVPEFLDESLRATRRGADLTEKLLSFGRKATLRPEPTDLADAGKDLLAMVRRTLPPNIVTELDLDDGPYIVRVDPSQLQNALLNLVLNARDALPDGGAIRISACPVKIEAGHPLSLGADALQPGAYVKIIVRDDGTGIPADVIEHVFDPFFTTKEIGEGSGLGLAMVYGFVRQSGGQTVIESTPGEGTAVNMFLPREIGARSIEPPKIAGPARGTIKNQRILLVEDAEDVRRVVDTQLRRLGYRTTIAVDGASALDLLRNGLSVDLLLSDIAMPGPVQGDELVSLALAEGHVDRALCMSGRPDVVDYKAFPQLNGVRILRKPIDMAKLADEIRNALSH